MTAAKTPKDAKDTKTPKLEGFTTYMVLGRDASSYWHELGTAEARTPNEAKKNRAKVNPDFEAYVAVPARSWKPSTRKVEQVEKETWS